MNLTKFFNLQRQLDEHILDEHPELKGQDNLDWKILALQVELGECANEWRGFKKWSNDQKPITALEEHLRCEYCRGKGEIYVGCICDKCEGKGEILNRIKNPLLEEYVDSLHFILSIGLELGYEDVTPVTIMKEENITDAFLSVMEAVVSIDISQHYHDYEILISRFIELGEMLGFTWEQIEQAYLQKNEVNHQRQESGY